jgi:S1-C subfamily serine protease
MKNAFLIFLASLALVSCTSVKEPGNLYTPVNYTQEDAVNDEIKKIDSIGEKRPSEALWRSAILHGMSSSFSQTKDVKSHWEEELALKFKEALEAKNYIAALSLYDSLQAVDYKSLSSFSSSSRILRAQIEKSMPVLGLSSGGKRFSEMINGTVTVYVDKGIKVEQGRGYADAMLGSGFFITKNGYIVTNHHVIADCVDPSYNGFARLYVLLAEDSETRIPARVVGYDSVLDLALLKAEVDAPYVFNLGSSSSLEAGDRVFAIGSPLGLDRTITSGIISATDRELLALTNVFQLDAAVNSGNSGGPLIDEHGNVRAVVFAGVANYQGLNFAIPVEALRSDLPFLFAGGGRTHGWFQAFGKTKRLPGAGAKNEGVEIVYCMPGGSAYLAGLVPGDIVVSLDGEKITSIEDLHALCLKKSTGTICRLEALSSSGEKKSALVYLSERPKYPGYDFYTHDLISSSLLPICGMELVRVSTSDKRAYSIKKILKGSSADLNGFSEGDPVELLDVTLDKEKSMMQLTIYAKKRKNGFLDVGVTLVLPLDSNYYL